MLYLQHPEKCLMDNRLSVYILNEWIGNFVSGEEIGCLEDKAVKKANNKETV